MSILVGRMYRFQCDRCGYRVDSIGGQLQGPGFELITIDCRHCRRLFDVLSKIELLRPISERVFRPSTSLAWTLPPSRWSQVEQHMGLVTGSLTRKRDFRYRLKAHTPHGQATDPNHLSAGDRVPSQGLSPHPKMAGTRQVPKMCRLSAAWSHALPRVG